MKATELKNRIMVLGKKLPSKKSVNVPFTDSNIALFQEFVKDNESEYTLANYPSDFDASRQFLFDIAAFFNPLDSGQLIDIRTKFYKNIVEPYFYSIRFENN